MIDVTEILVHWHAGRSLNEMSQSLGVDRKTIRKYVAPAVAAGIVPGGPARSEGEWQELLRGWFPELSDTRLRQVTWPAIAVHHEYITAQLKAGVRMSTVHQRLRDEHGLAASVASFRRYVAANVPEEAAGSSSRPRSVRISIFWSPTQALGQGPSSKTGTPGCAARNRSSRGAWSCSSGAAGSAAWLPGITASPASAPSSSGPAHPGQLRSAPARCR